MEAVIAGAGTWISVLPTPTAILPVAFGLPCWPALGGSAGFLCLVLRVSERPTIATDR